MTEPKTLGQANFVGKELPGDDLTGDFDPMQSEHAETDIDELDSIIERDLIGAPQKEQAPEAPADEQSEVEQQASEEQAEEQPEAESEEQVEAQPEGEEEQQAEGEEEAAEATDPVDDRLSALEIQLQKSQLENEKTAADTERWKLIAERESARAGNLQQQVRQTIQPQQQSESFYPETEAQAPEQSQRDPALTEALEDLNVQAMNAVQAEFEQEASAFLSKLGDQNGQSEAFGKDFYDAVQEHAAELKDVATRGRPRAAATLTRSVFRSAMADAKIKRLERQETAAREMKAKQRSATRAKKVAASGVKSSPAAASKQARKGQYDPLTVSLDDFDRHLDNELGTNKDAGSEMI